MHWPTSTKGVLVAIGAAIAVVLLLYTSGAAVFLVGVLIIAAVLYLVYAIGVRIHRWITRTRMPRPGGEE